MIAMVIFCIGAGVPQFYFKNIDGTLVNPVIKFNHDYEIKENEDNELEKVYFLETDKKVYHLGETVYGIFKFCKYKNVPATLRWTLANRKYVPYVQKEETSNTVGCFEQGIEWPIEQLLLDTSLGPNHSFNGTIKYKANSLRTITFTFKTNNFSVIR